MTKPQYPVCIELRTGAAVFLCNRKLLVTVHRVVSREVFCHEYGKIPRHTGQNPITEGDLEWILTKLL